MGSTKASLITLVDSFGCRKHHQFSRDVASVLVIKYIATMPNFFESGKDE